ncbi:MAG: hypothetical protein EOP86_04730 [Verrucomicrobiaceae bacterium]|nr:MAG: hypothetical protein EOP86_04730 [Verrucomicrobiaceae bacterium]
MKKPSLDSLGLDLLETTVGERVWSLGLPFLTCAGFFAAAAAGWWELALGCAVLQSYFTYASVSHDLAHRTLRLPRWLNGILLSLIEGMSFRSGHAFRVTHLEHHRHFPDAEKDPEGAVAGMPWWRALLEGLIAQPRWWFWALGRARAETGGGLSGKGWRLSCGRSGVHGFRWGWLICW